MYVFMLENDADRELVEQLYIRNRQKLFYAAQKIVKNQENAEDAVHACFERLTDRFDGYRQLSFEELEKLCMTIVQNAALDTVRANRNRGEFHTLYEDAEDSIADTQPDILEQVIKQYDRDRLLQALEALEPEERHLLALRYELCLPPREICRLTNLSSSTIRKRTLRSRKRLADILTSDGYPA